MELQEDSASMHRKTKILNLFRNKLGRFDSSIERIFVSDVAFFFYMFYVCWIDNYAIENFFLMKLKHDESYIKDFNRKVFFFFREKNFEDWFHSREDFKKIGVQKYVQINSISLNKITYFLNRLYEQK